MSGYREGNRMLALAVVLLILTLWAVAGITGCVLFGVDIAVIGARPGG